MPEDKVTCRYCASEDTKSVPVPGGHIPLCDRHAAELNDRAVRDLDRIMGQPVNYSKVHRRADDAPPAGEPGTKPDPTF